MCKEWIPALTARKEHTLSRDDEGLLALQETIALLRSARVDGFFLGFGGIAQRDGFWVWALNDGKAKQKTGVDHLGAGHCQPTLIARNMNQADSPQGWLMLMESNYREARGKQSVRNRNT